MTLTVDNCEKYLDEYLGALPVTREVLSVINDAGHYLVNAHPWKWLQGRSTTLNFTASQDYVDLPSDIRAITGRPYVVNALTYFMEPSTLDEILELRTSVTAAQLDNYHWAVSYRNVSNVLTPTLELYPTPTTTITDAVRIFYLAGWTQVTTDASTLIIPEWMEPLYLQVLVEVAKGYEEHDVATTAARLQMLRQSQIWIDVARRDGGLQPMLGPERNGAADGQNLLHLPHWNTFAMQTFG